MTMMFISTSDQQKSTDRHLNDSDVNLEIILCLSPTPARFYLSVDSSTSCTSPFSMHDIIQLLRNVHYWKRSSRIDQDRTVVE